MSIQSASRQIAAPQASFRGAGIAPAAKLNSIGTVVTLRRNETLFEDGDPAEYRFKVVHGVLRACKLLADGRRHINHFYFAGDFVGFEQSDAFDCSAEAVTDVTLIRYRARTVAAMVHDAPQIAHELLSAMCRDLLLNQRHLLLLGRKTASERLASFLLVMSEHSDDEDRIVLPMTRSDIADYLGLTTETVSRTITQLKQDGIISLGASAEIRIEDRDALSDLADGM